MPWTASPQIHEIVESYFWGAIITPWALLGEASRRRAQGCNSSYIEECTMVAPVKGGVLRCHRRARSLIRSRRSWRSWGLLILIWTRRVSACSRLELVRSETVAVGKIWVGPYRNNNSELVDNGDNWWIMRIISGWWEELVDNEYDWWIMRMIGGWWG